MKIKYGFWIVIFLLTGCAWFEESEHIVIIGKYEVGWNDLESNRAITKRIDSCIGCSEIIVDNYVFAVGHNDKFIIAKQHFGFDTTRTFYFLIDISKNNLDTRKGIHGPLNLDEFNSLKKKLNIENLDFDILFKERPKI